MSIVPGWLGRTGNGVAPAGAKMQSLELARPGFEPQLWLVILPLQALVLFKMGEIISPIS